MFTTGSYHLLLGALLLVSGICISECTTVDPHSTITAHNTPHNNTHTDMNGTHSNDTHSTHDNHTTHGEHSGVHLASWNFSRVATPLLLSVILIMAGFLKLVFHYAECLSSIIPESCLLIVFGIVVGAILHTDARPNTITLEPDVFMLYLLPPIVLDSAYSLNDRVVFQNIGAILLFAVIGTIINYLLIGPALYGLSLVGAMGTFDISLVQCLLFSSFIVAVDPVAVLAIFQEVGVNNKLYFLVFGESLLNDAVTIVLYNTMLAFNHVKVITWGQILTGIGSFFTVSLGACLIGFLFGIISALVTRLTSYVRVVEPLAVLMIAYTCYLFAELFHWSGIVSLIVCGLMQAEYSQHNISRKSYITVKYFIKMLATTSDTVIFVFLGLEVVRTTHEWHTGFVLWSLALCLIARLATTMGISFCINKRHKTLSLKEQFIMWYGGLRGAVCFALAATIKDDFEHKNVFLTTTMVIIFFTVFIQGITIKPFVNCCNIALAEEKENGVALEFNSFVVDHLMAATEALAGQQGDHVLRAAFERLNNKYFRKWLQSNPMTQDQRLLQTYQKVALKDHQRHIYEATHKELHIKTTDETEPVAPDIYIVDDKSEKKPGAIISNVLNGRQGDNRPGDGIAKLRWAVAKTALLTTTAHYDRNLTHDDEEDFAAKLREKHQRIEHNHYLREVAQKNENNKNMERNGSVKPNGASHGVKPDNNLNKNNSTESDENNVAAAPQMTAEERKKLSDLFNKQKGPKMDMFMVAKMLKQKKAEEEGNPKETDPSNGASIKPSNGASNKPSNGASNKPNNKPSNPSSPSKSANQKSPNIDSATVDIDTSNLAAKNSDSSGRNSPNPTFSEKSFHTAVTTLDIPVAEFDELSKSLTRSHHKSKSPKSKKKGHGVVNRGFVKDKDDDEITEL